MREHRSWLHSVRMSSPDCSTTRALRLILLAMAVALTTTAVLGSAQLAHLDDANAVTLAASERTAAPAVADIKHASGQVLAASVAPLPNQQRGCALNPRPGTTSQGRADGCRILIIGDSLGNNLASGVQRQLSGRPKVEVIVRSKGSTGLSNLWFYDWPAKLKPMITAYKPHLVIVMLGANDHQDFKLSGQVVRFGTTPWSKEYSRRIQMIQTIATDRGAYVAWIGLPVMAPPRYSQAMRTLNGFYARAESHIGAVFIPTWDYFATTQGAYRQRARVNSSMTKLRGDDGIHFTTAGGEVLGSFVLSQVGSTFNIGLASTHPKRITG